MTPRLVLLTGPAAGEVAKALRPEDCERCDVSMEPCSLCPVRLDFEVRDYWEAIVLIVQDPPVKPHCKTPKDWAIVVGIAQQDVRSVGTESRIRSVTLDCETCRNYRRIPARLAILAPEPPPLLVERVRAWGGEVWWCSVDEHEGPWARIDPTPARVARDCLAAARTWPEAVRAALGEVAP